MERLFRSFLMACQSLPPKPFHGNTGAFTISIYDAVFAAVCTKAMKAKKEIKRPIDASKLAALKKDEKFVDASQSRTRDRQRPGSTRTRSQFASLNRVMPTIIDKLHDQNAAILQLLMTAKEVSMYSDLDDKLKKVPVMSAASYFENEAKDAIHAFVAGVGNHNLALSALVKNKAILAGGGRDGSS